MNQVIYIDILFCVNLIVNYFLLLATAKFCAKETRRWRIAVGATVGAVYALTIFLPKLHFILALLIKLLFSASLTAITFGVHSLRLYLKQLFLFYCANILFAGGMILVWLFIAPQKMLINNTVVYFNISPVTLILTIFISYIVVVIINRVLKSRLPDASIFQLRIEYQGKSVMLDAFLDSGNRLQELFSEKSVIVCSLTSLLPLLSKETVDLFSSELSTLEIYERLGQFTDFERYRLIPFSALSNEGFLLAFLPERITITRGKTVIACKEAYIGIAKQSFFDGSYNALINGRIFAY